MANISQNRYQFPTVEDFSGAVAAIIRLQDTYNLEPSTIAKGKLSSKGLSMTSKYIKSDVWYVLIDLIGMCDTGK